MTVVCSDEGLALLKAHGVEAVVRRSFGAKTLSEGLQSSSGTGPWVDRPMRGLCDGQRGFLGGPLAGTMFQTNLGTGAVSGDPRGLSVAPVGLVGRDADRGAVGGGLASSREVSALVPEHLVGEHDHMVVAHTEIGVPAAFGQQRHRLSASASSSATASSASKLTSVHTVG